MPLVWYIKAAVTTAITSYPFFLLVEKLSSIDTGSLTPCNEVTCMFLKVVEDESLPSTFELDHAHNPFMSVRNGDKALTPDRAAYLPPRCPGSSQAEMLDICASKSAKEKIVNPLAGSVSKYVYSWSIFGWAFLKLVHDSLVLSGVKDVTTLRVGVASVLFQLAAAATGFVFSMSASEVFVAPLSEGRCGCYYQFNEWNLMLAMVTPMILFKIVVAKIDSVCRAAIAGDYLYFMEYDIPHRLVMGSLPSPTGSFLVSNTFGQLALPSETRPVLTTQQLRPMLKYLKLMTWVFLLAVVPCVSFTAGPIAVRLIRLALNEADDTPMGLVAFIIIIPMPVAYVCIMLVKRWVRCGKKCGLRDRFWESSYLHRSFSLLKIVFLVSINVGSMLTLITPLVRRLFGAVVDHSRDAALRWSLAAMLYLVFGVSYGCHLAFHRVMFRIVQVKARLNVTCYDCTHIAKKYPQFNLDAEASLAKRFVEEHGSHPHSLLAEELIKDHGLAKELIKDHGAHRHGHAVRDWEEKWKQALEDSSRDDENRESELNPAPSFFTYQELSDLSESD